jgi:glycosyltransferase involved in cell wall biosynthesis
MMPQSKPSVSVLMTVRNGAAYLPRAIDSILTQTLTDLEMVIVDDGSTDATANIIAGHAARDSRLRALTQEPSGIATGLNRAVAAARSELIAILDSDDIAVPDRLERQVAWMEEHPDIAVLGGSMIEMDYRERKLRTQTYPLHPAHIREVLRRGTAFCHPAVAMRKRAVEAVGGYRAAFEAAEDYDLWLRLAERADMANLPDVLVYYRLHWGQVTQRFTKRQANAAHFARLIADGRSRGKPDPLDAGFNIEEAQRLVGVRQLWHTQHSPEAIPASVAIIADPLPAVSVVMTARTNGPFLKDAVASVLSQTLTDIELVLVDDGSTDDLAATFAEYERQDRRVRTVRQLPGGIAAASNLGIRAARAELIARLDYDDVAVPDRLEKQVSWLSDHPNVAILGGWITMIDANDRTIATNAYRTAPHEIREGLVGKRGVMAHTATTMRKSVVVAVGGYRSQFDYASDYDLWLRVAERADLANLPAVMAYYRLHAGQVSQRFGEWQRTLVDLALGLAQRRHEGRPDPIEAGMTAEAAIRILGLELRGFPGSTA